MRRRAFAPNRRFMDRKSRTALRRPTRRSPLIRGGGVWLRGAGRSTSRMMPGSVAVRCRFETDVPSCPPGPASGERRRAVPAYRLGRLLMRTVNASRYVTPLREGGSLPAIIEADDEGMYVLKFRGAGQGAKALIAELLCGEIARALGLPIPELVFVELPADMARTEPDPEIASLIAGSAGLNVALDYLPGSVTFDPLIFETPADLASRIVWFDAYICNVDRTARNVNMLLWHRNLWLIDHGAALYFQHAWTVRDRPAATPFQRVKDHVLLPRAAALEAADAAAKARLDPQTLAQIVALIPEAWLADDEGFPDRAAQRAAYERFFVDRLRDSHVFVTEALSARHSHV